MNVIETENGVLKKRNCFGRNGCDLCFTKEINLYIQRKH